MSRTCKNCIHYPLCLDIGASRYDNFDDEFGNTTCTIFKDKSKFIELPCAIGNPYFTIERFCTEGGYHKEKEEVYLSDCEYCCEECDMELRIVEHKFCSVITILQKEKYIGKYIFLTREEAEKKLEELNESKKLS